MLGITYGNGDDVYFEVTEPTKFRIVFGYDRSGKQKLWIDAPRDTVRVLRGKLVRAAQPGLPPEGRPTTPTPCAACPADGAACAACQVRALTGGTA